MEPVIRWQNTNGIQISRDMKIVALKKFYKLPKETSSCMTNRYLDLISLQTSSIYRLEWSRFNEKLAIDPTISHKHKCALNVAVVIAKLEGYFRQKNIPLFLFGNNALPDKQ